MDHRVRVAKALAERLAHRNATNQRFIQRVVHQHVVGEYRQPAGLVADAQCIERGKGIRPQLNARADLAHLGSLFEHLDAQPLT